MRRAVIPLVAALVLAACAGNSSSSTDATKALADKLSAQCSAVSAPELGEGNVCFNNGFRLASDQFSFANWGRSVAADANVTVQTLVDLFGHAAVCMPGSTQECILRPTAAQRLEQWNNALSGGRCEGMATLTTRLFLKYDYPQDFSPTAQRTSDLSKSNTAVAHALVHWWATQFLSEVADRAAESRALSPLQLVEQLLQGLAKNVGYTLGMYYAAQGHSVTPFAITERSDAFVIHVYDNNDPGVRHEVLVNKTNDTWNYPNAQTSLDGSPINWSGATGSLELVPISSRQGPFTCPFCNEPNTGSPRILTVTSRDQQSPGYVLIRTRSGKTLSSSPQGIVNSISHATITVGKGGDNGSLSVSIPESAGDFDVFIRRASAEIPASDVVVNLRRAGAADIQVSGNVAEVAIGSKAAGNALLAIREKSTVIHAPTAANARVSIAAGTYLSRTNLDAHTSLEVRNIERHSIDVSLKGALGEANATLPAASTSASTESTWTLNEEHQLVGIHNPVASVAVSSAPSMSFIPRKAPQTTTTTAVPSSIVISRPD